MGAPPQNVATGSGADEDLLCPLCEYNLRGLPEPRCPECGYHFDWDKLRRQAREQREFFFEHCRKGFGRAFLRTAAQTTRPRRFWRYLQPAVPYSARLLEVYARIVLFVTVAPFALVLARRALIPQQQAHGSIWRFLDSITTSNNQWLGWATLSNSVTSNLTLITPAVTIATLLAVLWPVLSFFGLLIFQVSMGRARIRTVHVARCVVYSADALFWAGGLMAIVVGALCVPVISPYLGNSIIICAIWIAYLLCVLIFIYRLILAYQHYLRFDHPALTVLSVQIMVGITMMILLLVAILQRWLW